MAARRSPSGFCSSLVGVVVACSVIVSWFVSRSPVSAGSCELVLLSAPAMVREDSGLVVIWYSGKSVDSSCKLQQTAGLLFGSSERAKFIGLRRGEIGPAPQVTHNQ